MLKYLFIAHFADGSFVRQDFDDRSINFPGKSAFADVKERLDELVWFRLFETGPELTSNKYIQLDLTNGLFLYGDISDSDPLLIKELKIFSIEDPTRRVPPDAKYKLIYFRRHTATFHEMVELTHNIEYVIGYQTTDIEGKNYQQVVVLT